MYLCQAFVPTSAPLSKWRPWVHSLHSFQETSVLPTGDTRIVCCIFYKAPLSSVCRSEDLTTAVHFWPLLRRTPFMQIAKDQGSLSWLFLLLRRILAGKNKRYMSRCQRFTASLNKERYLKAQPMSSEQGWRRIPSASYPVQSCLWRRIMALCNLAWGQEGVCMLVVAPWSQRQPECYRRSKQLWDVSLGPMTTF